MTPLHNLPMRKINTKKYIVFFFKISLAILAVWYLFSSGRLTEEGLIRFFKLEHLPFFILSALVFLSSQLLASVRILLLLKMIDIPLRFAQGFKLTMIGNFFNMVIPGMIGGDFIKAFLLFRNEEASRGRSAGIVAMDRVLGMFALLFIAGVSFFYLTQRYGEVLRAYSIELQVLLIILGVSVGLFMALFILGKNERVRQKLRRFTSMIFRREIFYHMAEGFGAISKNRGLFIYSLFISLLIQLLSLLGLLIPLNIIHETIPNLIPLTAVSSVIMILGAIPVTPGNIGWTELIAAIGWSAVGSNTGAEVFFYWRMVIIFCSLPGAFLYYSPKKKKSS